MASRAEVGESFKRLFPEADITDLGWLVLDGQGFKIEINTGRKEPCEGLTLHVRGSDGALKAVTQIALNFEARAFDMTACQFLDRMSDPASGFKQWRKYSRRVAGAARTTGA